MPPEPDPLLAMAPDHPRLLRLARRLLGDPDAAQDAVAHTENGDVAVPWPR